jgi:hypothetical protein
VENCRWSSGGSASRQFSRNVTTAASQKRRYKRVQFYPQFPRLPVSALSIAPNTIARLLMLSVHRLRRLTGRTFHKFLINPVCPPALSSARGDHVTSAFCRCRWLAAPENPRRHPTSPNRSSREIASHSQLVPTPAPPNNPRMYDRPAAHLKDRYRRRVVRVPRPCGFHVLQYTATVSAPLKNRA